MKTDPKIKMHTAKCPGCGIKHKVRMFYSGNGTLRIYCKNCAGILNRKGIVDYRNN